MATRSHEAPGGEAREGFPEGMRGFLVKELRTRDRQGRIELREREPTSGNVGRGVLENRDLL